MHPDASICNPCNCSPLANRQLVDNRVTIGLRARDAFGGGALRVAGHAAAQRDGLGHAVAVDVDLARSPPTCPPSARSSPTSWSPRRWWPRPRPSSRRLRLRQRPRRRAWSHPTRPAQHRPWPRRPSRWRAWRLRPRISASFLAPAAVLSHAAVATMARPANTKVINPFCRFMVCVPPQGQCTPLRSSRHVPAAIA